MFVHFKFLYKNKNTESWPESSQCTLCTHTYYSYFCLNTYMKSKMYLKYCTVHVVGRLGHVSKKNQEFSAFRSYHRKFWLTLVFGTPIFSQESPGNLPIKNPTAMSKIATFWLLLNVGLFATITCDSWHIQQRIWRRPYTGSHKKYIIRELLAAIRWTTGTVAITNIVTFGGGL